MMVVAAIGGARAETERAESLRVAALLHGDVSLLAQHLCRTGKRNIFLFVTPFFISSFQIDLRRDFSVVRSCVLEIDGICLFN
jgi:hypothetical protein